MTNSPKSELRAGTGARTRRGAGFGAGLWAGGRSGVGAGFCRWWGAGFGFGLWFRPGSGFGFGGGAWTGAGAPLGLASLVVALGLLAALGTRFSRAILNSRSRARPGARVRSGPGPGIVLLVLLPFFLTLFALRAATPAAVLVLLSAVAALFFLLLVLALILLATRSAAGTGSRSVDKIRYQNWVSFDSLLCPDFSFWEKQMSTQNLGIIAAVPMTTTYQTKCTFI